MSYPDSTHEPGSLLGKHRVYKRRLTHSLPCRKSLSFKSRSTEVNRRKIGWRCNGSEGKTETWFDFCQEFLNDTYIKEAFQIYYRSETYFHITITDLAAFKSDMLFLSSLNQTPPCSSENRLLHTTHEILMLIKLNGLVRNDMAFPFLFRNRLTVD